MMLDRLICIENGYAEGILGNGMIKSRICNVGMWKIIFTKLPVGMHASSEYFEDEEGVPNEF
jgi:hypothetical protein